MLKKLITAGAISMAVCGVSFGKTGALDIVESILKDVDKQGNTYQCVGDDSHATCHLNDVNGLLFQIKNLRADLWVNDDEVKQEISGNIELDIDDDVNKFVPKSFTCNSKSVLKDLQYISDAKCIIKADAETLIIDSKSLLESRTFRYKTVPTILIYYIENIKRLDKEYRDIRAKYQDKFNALEDKFDIALDDIETNIELLKNTKKITNHNSNCGCNSCYLKNNHKIDEQIEKKRGEEKQIRQSYLIEYNEIKKQYDEDMQRFTDSIVAWLKQYNYTMKEARIHIKTNEFANSAFETFAKTYLMFNEYDLSLKQQQKQINEEKKRITAKYYSDIESFRAGGITFIEQSPYLKQHLKDSLKKVIAENVKLLDPHSHKISIKILIKPREYVTMNVGDEVEKMISIYNEGTTNSFLKAMFDIVNKYDIKSVRVWTE